MGAFEKLQRLQESVQELNESQIEIRVSEDTSAAFEELANGILSLQETTGIAVENALEFSEQLGTLIGNVTESAVGLLEMSEALKSLNEFEINPKAFEAFGSTLKNLANQMAALDKESGGAIDDMAEFAQTIQQLVSGVESAVAGLVKIATGLDSMDFTIDEDSLRQFTDEFKKLTELILGFEKDMGKAVEKASEFASEMKGFVSDIADTVNSLLALPKALAGLSDISLDSNSLNGLESKINAIAKALIRFAASSEGSVKKAKAFADEINAFVSSISSAVSGLSNLATGLEDLQNINIDSSSVKRLVDKVRNLAEELLRFGEGTEAAIKEAGEFTSMINNMVGGLSGAIEGLKGINDELDSFDFRLDTHGFNAFKDAIEDLAGELNEFKEDVGKAVANANGFAGQINELVGNVLNAVDGFEQLADTIGGIKEIKISSSDLDNFFKKLQDLADELVGFSEEVGATVSKAGEFAGSLANMSGSILGAIENIEKLAGLLEDFDVRIDAHGVENLKKAFSELAEFVLELQEHLDEVAPNVEKTAGAMATLANNFMSIASGIADAVGLINSADFSIDAGGLNAFRTAVSKLAEEISSLAPEVAGYQEAIQEFGDVTNNILGIIQDVADAVESLNFSDFQIDSAGLTAFKSAVKTLISEMQDIAPSAQAAKEGLQEFDAVMKSVAATITSVVDAVSLLNDSEFEIDTGGMKGFQQAVQTLASELAKTAGEVEKYKESVGELQEASGDIVQAINNIVAAVETLNSTDFVINLSNLNSFARAVHKLAKEFDSLWSELSKFEDGVSGVVGISGDVADAIYNIVDALAMLNDNEFSIDVAGLSAFKRAAVSLANELADLMSSLDQYEDAVSAFGDLSSAISRSISSIAGAVSQLNDATFEIDPNGLRAFKTAAAKLAEELAGLFEDLSKFSEGLSGFSEMSSSISGSIGRIVDAVAMLKATNFAIDKEGLEAFRTATTTLTQELAKLFDNLSGSADELKGFSEIAKTILAPIKDIVSAVSLLNTDNFIISSDGVNEFKAAAQALVRIIIELEANLSKHEEELKSFSDMMNMVAGSIKNVVESVSLLNNTDWSIDPSALTDFGNVIKTIAEKLAELGEYLTDSEAGIGQFIEGINSIKEALYSVIEAMNTINDTEWSIDTSQLRALQTAINELVNAITLSLEGIQSQIDINIQKFDEFKERIERMDGKVVNVYVRTHYQDVGKESSTSRIARQLANG